MVVTWDLSNSGSWNVAVNWSTDMVPVSTDNVAVENGFGPIIGSGVAAAGNHVYIGRNGNGTLRLEAGGKLTSGTGWIADEANHQGQAVVTGADSEWRVETGFFSVGGRGKGTLRIEDGGKVTTLHNTSMGELPGSEGYVTVTGAGSAWNHSGGMVLGYDGTGSLTVEDSGHVTARLLTISGRGSGEVNLNGGTITLSSAHGAVTIGNAGTGTGKMTISNGGDLISGTASVLGSQAGSSGTVLVTGSGSTWTSNEGLSTGVIVVGLSGAGSLTVSDGAAVSITGTQRRISVANQAGSTGSLNIGAAAGDAAAAPGTLDINVVRFGLGAGVLNFNHTSDGYTFNPIIEGNGRVVVSAGTTILAGANTYTGGTTIEGGTLKGNTSSLQGDIELKEAADPDPRLVFNQTLDGEYTGTISGAGIVERTGSGELILSGESSYTGSTKIGSGTLVLKKSTSAGQSEIEFSSEASSTLRVHNLTLENVLAGFGTGDLIDLQTLNFADGTITTGFASGKLTVTQGATTVTLKFEGLAEDSVFTATKDEDGSTLIDLNDAPTGSVTITGTPAQGQTLAASNTLADEDGLGAITYQWKADGAPITGATDSTYTLTQAEVGKTITVVASYTDAKGTPETKSSLPTSTVANVNDAPVITSNGGGDSASISVAENHRGILTTVSATDPDGDTLTFGLTGADASRFSIDARTGALSFLTAPDFENASDGDGDNVYIVEVTASDGNDKADRQVLAVRVTDVEEKVDGVPVIVTKETGADGRPVRVITIPVVDGSRREEDSTTPNADIPIVMDGDQALLTIAVPVGFGVRVENSLTPTSQQDDLLQAIRRKTEAGSADQTEMIKTASTFLSLLDEDVDLTVRTIIPTAPDGAAPGQPLIIKGQVDTSGQQEALVIDARGLPAGTVIQLENVEFAAIVGAVRVTGGSGSQVVVGDSSNQIIVLGEDDDVLYGGAGDDTVGSLGGNDRVFGEEGDDIVSGGTGQDRLDGGGF